MANHGFVTTKKRLTTDILEALVRKVNQDRFAGAMIVSRNDRNVVVENGLFLWLASTRKIEIRDQVRGDYGRWIENVVTNDIAIELDGTISSEGIGDKWKGRTGLYPTLRSYINAMRDEMNSAYPSSSLGLNQIGLETWERKYEEMMFDAVKNDAMKPYLGR